MAFPLSTPMEVFAVWRNNVLLRLVHRVVFQLRQLVEEDLFPLSAMLRRFSNCNFIVFSVFSPAFRPVSSLAKLIFD